MYDTTAFARRSKSSGFEKISIRRGDTGSEDVELNVKFCGICLTDVHLANDAFGNTKFPVVPGHEMAGVVVKVGPAVHEIFVGDHVGVGLIVDSCQKCCSCLEGAEQCCSNEATWAYNFEPKHGRISTEEGYTMGGFSKRISVHHRYVFKIPSGYPLEYAGPAFCAGVTMYSPLKHWRAIEGGRRVGIIGIGGLGQFGIKLASAMGNSVTAISSTKTKESTARRIGADSFVASTDPESIAAAEDSLDLIINTVSVQHSVEEYLPLLKRNGVIVQIGVIGEPFQVHQWPSLICKRLSVAGSLTGGMPECQEVIDFCTAKGIKPEIKVVKADELDRVFKEFGGKHEFAARIVLDVGNS